MLHSCSLSRCHNSRRSRANCKTPWPSWRKKLIRYIDAFRLVEMWIDITIARICTLITWCWCYKQGKEAAPIETNAPVEEATEGKTSEEPLASTEDKVLLQFWFPLKAPDNKNCDENFCWSGGGWAWSCSRSCSCCHRPICWGLQVQMWSPELRPTPFLASSLIIMFL